MTLRNLWELIAFFIFSRSFKKLQVFIDNFIQLMFQPFFLLGKKLLPKTARKMHYLTSFFEKFIQKQLSGKEGHFYTNFRKLWAP